MSRYKCKVFIKESIFDSNDIDLGVMIKDSRLGSKHQYTLLELRRRAPIFGGYAVRGRFDDCLMMSFNVATFSSKVKALRFLRNYKSTLKLLISGDPDLFASKLIKVVPEDFETITSDKMDHGYSWSALLSKG